MVHAELAVSLARDADRVWELGSAHMAAAVVPALRGEWEAASAHVEMATQAARATAAPRALAAAASAREVLATARGDLEGAADAAAAVRATGNTQFLRLLPYDWRSLEIDALIGLGRLDEAEMALAELEAFLSPAGAASGLVAAARLRGDLACAAGHQAAAARLVATGCSNRQTASELYVSVKTVEFHLGHIYDKLAIRSRKDLITRISAPQPQPEETLGPITRGRP